MKEYMFYIRNAGDAKAALSPQQHLAFVKSCEVYIGQLKAQGKLLAAQPLARAGIKISRQGADWSLTDLDPAGEVQVGYYHILAENKEDAIAIAKQNPEFAYVPSASIVIHPVKTKETETGFEYPR
jgi:hypothetical protein